MSGPYRDPDAPSVTEPRPPMRWAMGGAIVAAAAIFGVWSCNDSAARYHLRLCQETADRLDSVRDECRASGRVWHEDTDMHTCHLSNEVFPYHRGECWDREGEP